MCTHARSSCMLSHTLSPVCALVCMAMCVCLRMCVCRHSDRLAALHLLRKVGVLVCACVRTVCTVCTVVCVHECMYACRRDHSWNTSSQRRCISRFGRWQTWASSTGRHASTHASTHAHMCARTHARTHACTYTHMHARTHARLHARTHRERCESRTLGSRRACRLICM